MKIKENLFRRILSIFLVFCMVVSIPQIINHEVLAESNYSKITDPSTADGWKSFFGAGISNTENAGTVWTDKSVFSNDEAFSNYGITLDDENGFLVALSLIASNKSVSGLSNMPTDTMIVLDLSSSMYPSRNPSTVNTMVNAVNETIKNLQAMNVNNRVGVSVYFGGSTLWESTKDSSKVLLPLDRYTHANNEFLKTITSSDGSRLESVDVNSDVKNTANKTISASHVVEDVAGTYAQLGIIDAMNQFLRDDIDSVVPQNAEFQAGVSRVPVVVLMSDGEPTAATNNYTQKEDFKMGNNQTTNRNPAETDFVTQLTAAYAKEMIDRKYAETTPLFYTLSLGDSISMDIMNPKSNDQWGENVLANMGSYNDKEISKAWSNSTIKGYWNTLMTYGEVSIKVQNYNNGSYSNKTEFTLPVKKIFLDSNGTIFPSSINQKYYVDQSFTAENASSLSDAFSAIVSEIALQSKYFPTLVEDNENLGGYISFVDNIGKYMSVSSIKGIIIGDVLFSGADLASNFVEGGGSLGTLASPSPLGIEMVKAVQSRLGIKEAGVTEALIGEAYREGQLRYNNEKDFSNYIGWYANAAGEFLGFWYEGIKTMPDYSDESIPVEKRPAYIMKSYGYLGQLDAEHGIEKSDMMYAVVQVRESLSTGDQTVLFSVPASLVPMVSYDIALDENGNVTEFEVSGANGPMRLVYEVGLKDDINEITLAEGTAVDKEYLNQNTNSDGSVNFYTNKYEVDNSMGYGKVNAISYFRPSHQNEKYYFQESSAVYKLENGEYTKYTGEFSPALDGEYYSSVKVYLGDSLRFENVYRKLSDEALSVSEKISDGTWIIPVGTVHVNLDGYTVYKESNPTDTLKDASGKGLSNVPFVDIEGHKVNEVDHSFVVGATLGNNGKITITPETGIKISKSLKDTKDENTSFQFIVTSEDKTDGTYTAIKTDKDGKQTKSFVTFKNGVTTVEIKSDESIVIVGLPQKTLYTISEVETIKYTVYSVNGVKDQKDARLVTVDNKIVSAEFVNAERGKGVVTVSKLVKHNMGDDYVIPEGLTFEMIVSLSGVGSANATYDVKHSGDSNMTSLTTNEQGVFPVINLKNGEQIEINGLPEGTTVKVEENNTPSGFTPAYMEDGEAGDGVIVVTSKPHAVEVVNTYDHGKTTGNKVKVNGTKYLKHEDGMDIEEWGNAEFTIILEEYKDGKWVEIGRRTVDDENRTYEFDFASKEYASPGVYSYQIYELVPADEDRIQGMMYDPTYHTFSIVVTDEDMSGGLEITRVHSEHSGKEFTKDENGNWIVTPDFKNVQYNTAPAVVRIPIQKQLLNKSNSNFVTLAHHEFGIYFDAECENFISVGNGIADFELAATDAVGEAELDIVFDEAGEYVLYVKEINKGVKGMKYDNTVVKATVKVETSGVGGRLVANVSYDKEQVNGELVFVNEYIPESVSVSLDVHKELYGRDLTKDDIFTFEVRSGNDTVLKGTNDQYGKVTFEGILSFDKVGVYEYTVLETSKDGLGIKTDKTVYNVRITVTDNGEGKLKAEVFVAQVYGNKIVFKNTYSAKEAVYVQEGTKTMDGRPLLNDEFSFVMAESDNEGNIFENGKTYLAKNFQNGHFVFEKLTFKEVGVYYYTIYEIPENVLKGIVFDTSVYILEVEVTDDGLGALKAIGTLSLKDGTPKEALKFNNYYDPANAHVFIPGTKLFYGKVLSEGQFKFKLVEADRGWNPLRLIEEVTNTEDGRITFSDIEYETADSYYYLVMESYDAIENNGITYDDTVYRVRVDVTDGLKGFLHSSVHIYDDEGNPKPSIEFINRYNVTQGDKILINGEKELIGKDLEDDDFTFKLENKADGTFQTVKNKNSAFEFVLNYKGEDVGKTFEYILYEVNDGKCGIVYDTSVYTVVVQVIDNNEGGIKTVVSITKDGKAVDNVKFVNRYEITGDAEITIEGTKELSGKELKDGEFTFRLENKADGTFQSAKNENGAFEFVLQYKAEDAGNAFEYELYEVNDGIAGIEYDSSRYIVSVKVNDNGEGGIFVDYEIALDGKAVDKVSFSNKYESPSDISINIEINKVVENLGTEAIGPEGFQFVLKNIETGESLTVRSDADGKGIFKLGYTADDIGKVFNYQLSETDEGVENVKYSLEVYDITVKVKLTEENRISAEVFVNENSVTNAVCVFKNTYDYTPPAKPGDTSDTVFWSAVLFMSMAGLAFLAFTKKREINEN